MNRERIIVYLRKRLERFGGSAVCSREQVARLKAILQPNRQQINITIAVDGRVIRPESITIPAALHAEVLAEVVLETDSVHGFGFAIVVDRLAGAYVKLATIGADFTGNAEFLADG